jgi:hypothetical protein
LQEVFELCLCVISESVGTTSQQVERPRLRQTDGIKRRAFGGAELKGEEEEEEEKQVGCSVKDGRLF